MKNFNSLSRMPDITFENSLNVIFLQCISDPVKRSLGYNNKIAPMIFAIL